MNPLELIGAARWKRAAFTTFSLSLSFFEAVVLDALVRGGSSGLIIFSDPVGVRAALSEQGARRVGREYDLEPVACNTGCFHPKVTALIGEDAHLLVGSGNLSFGGWGANLELVDHLHPSFAADAFRDAASFFKAMADHPRVRLAATAECLEVAESLQRAAIGGSASGDIRLLHSLDRPIAEGIANFADELGGVERIVVASPFFDRDAGGLADLAARVGCDRVHLHVHDTLPVAGNHGLHWPFAARLPIIPICLETPLGADPRPLHAKTFELICRKGRIVVSGSPNASRAGLYGSNVELAVIRIERSVSVGWSFRQALAPSAIASQDAEDADAEAQHGVLQAVLDHEKISGFVLTPKIEGAATLTCFIDAALPTQQDIVVAHNGTFVGKLMDLEAPSWRGGRIVARIEQGSKLAEGFVSSLAARQLHERAGPMAQRLLAMLAGTETPADVAAIMSWFKEDLSRLPSAEKRIGGSGTRKAGGGEDVFVPLAGLSAAHSGNTSTAKPPTDPAEDSWQRTLHSLISAFKRRPGPWPDSLGQDNPEAGGETERQREARIAAANRAKQMTIDRASDLFGAMLSPAHSGRYAVLALQMAYYVIDTSRPDEVVVRNWFDAIIDASVAESFVDEPTLTGLSLIRFASTQTPSARNARRFLLHRGIDPANDLLNADSYPLFSELLAPRIDLERFLAEVRAVRAAGEEVQALLEAVRLGAPTDGYEGLKTSPYWPQLARAFNDRTQLQGWHIEDRMPTACPKCHISFNSAAKQDLRVFGVAECHSLTLVNAI